MNTVFRYSSPLLFASVCGWLGCFQVPINENARIVCTVNDDCPPDYVCRSEIDLCVPARGTESTPPEAADVAISPAVARVGVEVSIDFTSSEALLVDPVVTIVIASGERQVPARARIGDGSGLAWRAVYVASGDEGEGAHDVRALLVDRSGNVAADAPLGSLVFDFSPPGILSVDVTPAVARDGGALVVGVRTDEPLLEVSSALSIDGGRAFVADPPGADPLQRDFRLTIDRTAGDVEGDVSLTVSVADAAGNVAARTLAAAARLDFTAPALDGTLVIARPILSAGQTALLSFRSTEPVVDVAVELVPASGPALPMTLDSNSGRELGFRREIGIGDVDGPYTVRLLRLVDEAGNAADATDLAGSITIDQRAPAFVGPLTSLPAVASRVPGNDQVSVAFVLDEAATVVVRIGEDIVECAASGVAPAVAFACVRDIDAGDVDGVYGVTVNVADGAGNVSFAPAPAVTYDFTEPSLVVGVVPDRAARAGEIISVTAVANEVIDGTGVTVTTTGGLAFSPPQTSGASITTFIAVPAGLEGAFDIDFVASDPGGNTSTVTRRTLTIDGVAPSINAVSLSSPRVAPGENFTLTFEASEVLAVPPVVTFANGDLVGGVPVVQTMALVSGPSSTGRFVFSAAGPLTGQNQFYNITVLLEDLAGNQGADSPAVIEVDNVAPQLAGFDIAPRAARAGDSVRVIVTADETLGAAPAIVARNSTTTIALLADSPAPGAISYVFSFPVGVATPQGLWTFDAFDLVDAAGNNRTIAADAGRSFTVDSIAPNVAGITVTRAQVAVGASFDVIFSTSEAVVLPTVTVDGAGLSLLTQVGNTFTFRYVATGSEDEGIAGIIISVADAAGNGVVAGADVEFDFTAPSLTSSTVAPAVARTGSIITYAVSADEELATPPVLTVSGGLAFSLQPASSFVFTHTVVAGDAQGPRTTSVQMTDLAGNTRTVAGVGLAIDSVVPVVSNLVVTPARASLAAGFNVVTTTFTLSEAVGSGLSVVIAGTPTSCTNVGLAFSCTRNVIATDTAGARTVVVQAADAGGNVALATGAVEFDFTPPSVLSSAAAPAIARAGALTYQLSTSETVVAAPTLTVSGGSAISFAAVSGTTFSYTTTVAAAASSGPRTVQATLTDLAGNTATVATSGFTIDVSAPTITAINLGARPVLSTVAPFNTTTFSFTVGDSPSGPPLAVSASVGATVVACSQAGNTFSCPYTATGLEPSAATVLASVTDGAGNLTTAAATLSFDFVAPAVVGPVSLSLVAPSGTFNPAPTAATIGTTARVGFTLSETTAPPVVATIGAPPLSFALNTQAGTTFLFDHVVGSPPPQGPATVRVTATDAVGNSLIQNLTLPGAGLVFDSVAPAVPGVAVADRVTYERAPWGDATGALRLQIVGAPGAAEANAVVVAFNGATVGAAVELGRSPVVLGDGSFLLNLNGVDRAEVFISVMDGAGNLSDVVAGGAVQASRVRDVSWTASLGGKVANSTLENPHRFETRAVSLLQREQRDSTERSGGNVGVDDSAFELTTGQPAWEQLRGDAADQGRGLVYDEDRAVVWLPGGPTLMRVWDGFRWSEVDVVDAEGDGNPDLSDMALVYDRVRRETVGFNQRGETWIWNGVSWRLAALADRDGVTAPLPRFGFGLTWDDARSVVVIFGGTDATAAQATCEDDGACLADLWQWDGGEWLDVSSAGPPGRTNMAFAYDADQGNLVVFGGDDDTSANKLADTWVWDDGWTQASTTAVAARSNAALVHDPFIGGLIMFGGSNDVGAALSEQLFWDGSDWSPSPPGDPELDGNPQRRERAQVVYDRSRDQFFLFGGESDFFPNPCSTTSSSTCDDVWYGTSGSWRRAGQVTPTNLNPNPFGGTVAGNTAYERSRGTGLTLLGGQLFFFDGAAWRQQSQAGVLPVQRSGAAMAFDERFGRTVLFGGQPASSGSPCDGAGANGVCDGTFILNTTAATPTWTSLLPATRPSKRSFASMAFDHIRQRFVLFGGQGSFGGGTVNAETWEWTPSSATTGSWTQRCLAGACGLQTPTARAHAAMTWDRVRQRTVLFGGSSAVVDNNVYEFNGTSWFRITPSDPENDGNPASRLDATMVFDEGRRTALLFGKSTDGSCDGLPAIGSCADLWEWNGVSWRRLDVVTSPSGDFRPSPRTLHGSFFHAGRGETIVLGGADLAFETWRLRAGSSERPSHVARFDFRAAGASTSLVRDVRLNWIVGGTAAPAGVTVNGAQVRVLRDGRASLLNSNAASTAVPALLSTTLSTNIAALFSPTSELTFFAEPGQASGFGAGRSALVTDHVEVRVRYRLP